MSMSQDAISQVIHHGVDMLIERIERAEANAAEFSRRYNSECKRVNKREEMLNRIRDLHRPYEVDGSDGVRQRCQHCIAGYDPRTEELVNAAWPCSTIKAFGGDES